MNTDTLRRALNRTTLTALSMLAGSALAVVPCVAAPINTDPAGTASPQPYNNVQPSLAIHFSFPINGVWGAGVPIRMFAYADTKMTQLNGSGWVSPNGQVLSVNQNQALFSQLGTSYGGNGVTTFAIPDLRGRTPIGEGQGFGTSNYVRGAKVGVNTVTLTVDQLPAHTHTHAKSVSGTTGSAGGGQAVTSMQPSIAMNWSISTTGAFPPINGSGAPTTPISPYRGQLMLHAATPAGSYAALFESANGGLIPVSLNTALYALLGTSYGGNGQTNFGKPDLRGSTAAHVGQGPGLEQLVVGEVFGNEVAPLGVSNLPPHSHTVPGLPALPATGIAGGGQPFSNAQRTLAVKYLIALTGTYPGAGMHDDESYLGEIIAFAPNFTPTGYAECNGQVLPIAQNQSLFSLLGTTWGGNGVTTFALPDLRGRVPVGASLGAGGTAAGTVLGVEKVTLTLSNIPQHTHTLQPYCDADIGKQGGILGHDGFRDNNDFVVFINEFFMHHTVADFGKQGGLGGGDGLYDNNDFVAFIDAFFADCPW